MTAPPASIRVSAALHAAALCLVAAAPRQWTLALSAVAADHAVLAVAGMLPRSRLLGPNLSRLADADAVALTFDDGPDPEVTPRVLDLLDRQDAKATFFPVGEQARRHPRLVADIVTRGHTIGNHTMRHRNAFAALGPSAMRREIADAQAVLAPLAGARPRLFRAPMGLRNPFLPGVLAAESLALVSWTRRALDGVATDPRAAERRLLGGLAGGDILLMHDGRRDRLRPRDAVVLAVLPRVLAALRAAGLRAVAISPATAAAQQPGHHQADMHERQ